MTALMIWSVYLSLSIYLSLSLYPSPSRSDLYLYSSFCSFSILHCFHFQLRPPWGQTPFLYHVHLSFCNEIEIQLWQLCTEGGARGANSVGELPNQPVGTSEAPGIVWRAGLGLHGFVGPGAGRGERFPEIHAIPLQSFRKNLKRAHQNNSTLDKP